MKVPYALAVYNDLEIKRVIKVMREHRTNMGVETWEFEKKIAELFGKKFGVMVNSGSSANLLSYELLNLAPKSEIITPILTFSTTLAPILQKNLIPVFVDVEEASYVINIDQIENLISKKTRAIMVPLLLGNVPDLTRLKKIAKKHKLFLIEDSCDTLGATWNGKPTGTYSDITTTSFFGSHIITAGGNGGMILMNNPLWKNRAMLLRGWGRGSALFRESEDLKKRFGRKIGNIPYDAKYIFEDIGYNLLPVEMCAAFGNAQLDKLELFRKKREYNFNYLHEFFKRYEDIFILPKQYPNIRTQWLAFPLTIRKNAKFTRYELIKHLENNDIQTRPIFTGNVLKQPGFKKIPHRITSSGTKVANHIMRSGFVIGCHHGMQQNQLRWIKSTFTSFLKKYY